MRAKLLGILLLTACSLPAQAADACAVLDQFKPVGDVFPYRPLPILTPSESPSGTLTLDIHMRRAGRSEHHEKPLQIGKYLVSDVPVFDITPQASTLAQVFSPTTGKLTPLPAECLRDASWIFGGTHWQLTQGDHLRVKLTSDLDYDGTAKDKVLKLPQNGSVPCRSTNLHTHGFLVNPTQPKKPGEFYGDYVLDVTERPDFDPAAPTDSCGDPLMTDHASHHKVLKDPLQYEITIPGHPGQNGVLTGEHPSGLFWYHPHPHGFSRMQTGGGTTGLITIGSLRDYACKGKNNPLCPSPEVLANPRYLEIKDAQLSLKHTGGVHTLLPEYNSGICTDRHVDANGNPHDPAGLARRGECRSEGDNPPGIWVFTINGVQYPRISEANMNRDGEIWRIANTSANATYVLQIENAENRQDVKSVQILAVDGVSVGQTSSADPKQDTTVRAKSILLMPASRVELFITPEAGKTYILRTRASSTGIGADNWPDVDLAEIHWPAPPPAAITALRAPQQRGAAKAMDVAVPREEPKREALAKSSNPKTLPPACRFDKGDERHVYIIRNAVGDLESFGLVAGIRRANGTLEFFGSDGQVFTNKLSDVWERVTTAPHSPAYGNQPFSGICTLQGNVETWVVENWTGEDHNFHVHQTRFKLDTTASHIGNPAYYRTPQIPQDGPLGVMDNLIRNIVPTKAAASTSSALRNAYHDTVPIPRGESKCSATPKAPGCRNLKPEDQQCSGDPTSSLCVPSRLSIHIGFRRDEQVGRFVYHCHILEHEDGGMMGEIRVCAPDDVACTTFETHQHKKEITPSAVSELTKAPK